MLLELTITDFAIIDSLHLRFGPHLNVFTGETGAGKSIIVDAISALVGERVTADVVRAGADRAMVEGVFDVATLLPAPTGPRPAEQMVDHDGEEAGGEQLVDVLAELGVAPEEGSLILAREILASGRGIARV